MGSSNAVPLLWTIAQAGAAMSMSPWTVRYYVRTGKLTSVRIGSRIRIDPRDILRLIEAGKSRESVVNPNRTKRRGEPIGQ